MRQKKTHCRNGHEFTPENTHYREHLDQGKNGKIYRCTSRHCKTCISHRKRLRYQTDPAFRARSIAYNRWYRCGDPQGRIWDEIKVEITA